MSSVVNVCREWCAGKVVNNLYQKTNVRVSVCKVEGRRFDVAVN